MSAKSVLFLTKSKLHASGRLNIDPSLGGKMSVDVSVGKDLKNKLEALGVKI